MAQEEVLKFLTKNKGKKFNTREIQKKIQISNSALSSNLNKLCEQKLIKCKKIKDRYIFNIYWKK